MIEKTYISRNPFTRETTTRETIRTNATCDWCGQNHKGKLYIYWIESDGGRQSKIMGQFCSRACCKDCHGN